MVLAPVFRLYLFPYVLFLLFTFLIPTNSYTADISNCVLCHKYPGLSMIDEEGKFRLFYINEDIFANSTHARVKCEGCHTDIKKIPHDPAKKVDCLVECHITEPTSEKKFSHKDVAEFVEKSVHGKYDKDGKLKKYPEDLPTCKDCHDNPLYRPLAFFKIVRPGISEESLGRCRVCHKKEDFVNYFYRHVTTRLHKSRNPLNIAQMCGKCHDDPEKMARHGLSRTAFSYGETFHGKAASYLDERVPDCLDCHVKKGQSVHQMLSYKDPESPVFKDNVAKVCAKPECHPKGTEKLGKYRVHAEFNLKKNPVEYYFTLFFIFLTGGTLLPLMCIIFFDLLRRLFPNVTRKRRR
jgi:hypothetical protein